MLGSFNLKPVVFNLGLILFLYFLGHLKNNAKTLLSVHVYIVNLDQSKLDYILGVGLHLWF